MLSLMVTTDLAVHSLKVMPSLTDLANGAAAGAVPRISALHLVQRRSPSPA